MKCRTIYVSNSSSSSFVCIGVKVGKISDKHKSLQLDPKKRYVVEGKFLNDGSDLISLNQEMFDYVVSKRTDAAYEELDGRPVYELIAYGEYELSLSSEVISKIIRNKDENLCVFSMDVDYYSSDSLDNLIENYE